MDLNSKNYQGNKTKAIPHQYPQGNKTKAIPRQYPQGYKKEMLNEYLVSGKSQNQFCREHGLPLPTFNRWLQKEHQGSNMTQTNFSSSTSFIPLQIIDEVSSSSLTLSQKFKTSGVNFSDSTHSPDLQLKFPQGYVVTIPFGFEEDTLKRVIKVIGEYV